MADYGSLRKRRYAGKKKRITEDSVFWQPRKDGNKKGRRFRRGPIMGHKRMD